MTNIVKICKFHGQLTIDQVFQEKLPHRIRFKCRQCKKDYEARNKEKIQARSKEYEKTKRTRPENYYEDTVKVLSREWRRKNKDLVNNRVREDRKKNPDKYGIYDKSKRNKNIRESRVREVLKKYNISREEYERMFVIQDHKCKICGNEETKSSRTKGQVCKLAIDHDHETGEVRGLLCHECNTGLGKFKDSKALLQLAILYLENKLS